MSSVVYSLKNGINRTNNPTTGGVFAYGSYTSAGAFTLFTDYEYEDGTAFVSEPFDDTQPLVWKGSSQYPHLGFENLTPNSSITPQPFPSFGIYLHPFIEAGVRKDVGVRVTIPFGGSIAISSIIQRADTTCGDDIGYRIMKNGVAIQSRQFIQPSTTPTTINTPVNIFSAGDIIDFIVDIGSQSNSFCDDTALEVILSYQYTKIPTPKITTTPILCSTTTINGTTAFVSEGTVAELYIDSTLIYSTSVTLNLDTYSGSFSFTGLDLTESQDKAVKVILKKSGDVDSDFAISYVGDGGCVDAELQAPIVTSITACETQYIRKASLAGTSSHEGDVAIFKYPYTNGDDIIAAASSDGVFFAFSDSFEENQKYVGLLLNYDGIVGSVTLEQPTTCAKTFRAYTVIKGYAKGITNGIIRLYKESDETLAAIGIIRDEIFIIESKVEIPKNEELVLIAIKLN